MKKLAIILVRLAKAELERKPAFYGWTDLPISEAGKADARRVGKELAEENIDCIYTSPLSRAVKTAHYIKNGNKRSENIEIIENENLKEVNFGLWEGMSEEEIQEYFPDEWKDWNEDWEGFQIPGGESFESMYTRVRMQVKHILEKHSEGNIVLISHHGCIRAALCDLLDIEIEHSWKFHIPNCSVCRIEIKDDVVSLKQLN